MSNSLPTSLHILVAEDNQVNQMVARKLLERLGCTCVITGNGQKAIDILETGEAFDLILMDCMMPVLDGLEATQAIRASEKPYADIPIIAFTANTMDSDRRACEKAGMNDFLDKPVTIARMTEALQHWAVLVK